MIESFDSVLAQAIPIYADQVFALLGVEQYRTRTYHATNDDEVTLLINGYRQTRSFTCGYVAALSVAQIFRPKVNAVKLYRIIRRDERWGTDTPALRRGLRESGVGSLVRRDLTFAKISAYPAVTVYGTNQEVLGTAVRTERYRYAEYDDNRGAMLFDEAADPHELKNLANDPAYRKVRDELADLLPKTLPPLEGR